jgi:hypothetical protein
MTSPSDGWHSCSSGFAISRLASCRIRAPLYAEVSDQEVGVNETRRGGEIRLVRRSDTYWRVTFDLPPLNIFGPANIPQLEDIVSSTESDDAVKVVVFDSAVEGFFLTHTDSISRVTSRIGWDITWGGWGTEIKDGWRRSAGLGGGSRDGEAVVAVRDLGRARRVLVLHRQVKLGRLPAVH